MKEKLKNLPVFIVNLKKDIEKKEHMQKLCEKHSLNYRFFDAIYGKHLSNEEINQVYAQKEAVQYSGKGLSLGEIGCALSHKNIYRTIIDEKLEQALILEDDIEFNRNIEEILKSLSLFPTDWEVVLLGHHSYISRESETRSNVWWSRQITPNYQLKRPSEIGYGTYGYLINKRGAQKLFDKLKHIYKPIDHYTGNDKDVNIYIITPAPISIHTDMSDNFHSMDDRMNAQMNLKKINESKKLSPKQLLRSLGLFNSVVLIRDLLKTFIPLKKYMDI